MLTFGVNDMPQKRCIYWRCAASMRQTWLIGVAWPQQRLYLTLEGTPMGSDTSVSVPVRPLLVLSLAVAALLAGTGGLWAWYGTAVFFEMVRTGWAACF
jgi:hypothetical protein